LATQLSQSISAQLLPIVNSQLEHIIKTQLNESFVVPISECVTKKIVDTVVPQVVGILTEKKKKKEKSKERSKERSRERFEMRSPQLPNDEFLRQLEEKILSKFSHHPSQQQHQQLTSRELEQTIRSELQILRHEFLIELVVAVIVLAIMTIFL